MTAELRCTCSSRDWLHESYCSLVVEQITFVERVQIALARIRLWWQRRTR